MLPKVHLLADIQFLPTAEGGRRGPTPPERFGCPLEFEGEYFDCLLDLSERGPVVPGEFVRVPVAFLCPELILPRLAVGATFTLWEKRTIARGTVVELRAWAAS
jgi:hypothetical protein